MLRSTKPPAKPTPRGKSALAPACAGLVACAALVVPIRVPKSVANAVKLELSGAVWSPALSRYVLVSDDVNEAGGKHVPRLFTLSDDGKLDATAITVLGIDELNDPESITAGPDGSLFVCTSHSINKHGNLPKSRRRLLQLALAPDHKANIIGEVDLTTARMADGNPPWGERGPLDIEAIAFRDGALYIGLKSPLAADGSATILRLPDAVSVVKSGVVPPNAISVWARAQFCVPQRGESVCEGIADLAFLPDGALLVAANSPKGMPKDGGGALWQLSAAGTRPMLLKRFDGFKPEGVALAPDHKSAVIVFDTDGKEPIWTRWPLSP